MKTILVPLSAVVLKSSGVLNWLNEHLLACPFKSLTGIDCPGCGLQRSVLALMRGDFVASFKYYPATMAMLMLFIFAILHLKFDFKNGAVIIKMLYIFVSFVIVINYIYKIINHQLI